MGTQVQDDSNFLTMRRFCHDLMALSLLLIASAPVFAQVGVIPMEEGTVQIVVTNGAVEVTQLESAESADTDGQQRRDALQRQVFAFLQRISVQEGRVLPDEQSLYRASSYAKILVEKIGLLTSRVEILSGSKAWVADLQTATNVYDVATIKRLLHEKMMMEDDGYAEAAFQLGGFQEIDGEYQDAWANYQIASNLEPGNQLYMDAHGKNQF